MRIVQVLGVCFAATLALGAGTALAQPVPAPAFSSADRDYQEAFQDMLGDLSNPEKSFRFAEQASRAGDLRGAVAALERILLINPRLDNIRLELGVLYQRLGNPALAQAYLQQALQSPDAPPGVRERAQRILSEAERQASPHHFSASLFAGARYDTNANAGPSSNLVRGGGFDLRLDQQFTKDDDFSFVGLGSLRYVYDFGTQSGDRLETNLSGYLSRYLEHTEVNLGYLQLDVGPWLALDPVGSLSVRPFGSIGGVTLEDEKYLQSFGGGATLRKEFSPALATDFTYLFLQQQFYDTERRPTTRDRTGPQHTVRGDLLYQLDPFNGFGLSLGVIRENARVGFESDTQWLVGGSYTRRFDLGTLLPDLLSSTLSFRYWRANFDDPDPSIDPNVTRRDNHYEGLLSTSIPLTLDLAVVLNLQYTRVDSNLPNFSYDNFATTLGISWQM